jgi:DNA-binding NarL/FixJ family response regulator
MTDAADSISVVVVDDHAIVRDRLVALLSAMEGTHVVGQAEDAAGALALVAGRTWS